MKKLKKNSTNTIVTKDIIMTIDPSLRALGYSVIDCATSDILDAGCIRSKPIKGMLRTVCDTKDIANISDILSGLIDRYKVNSIVFEDPVGSKSSTANKALSLSKGAIIGVACAKGVPVRGIQARNIKMSLTGNRSAEKEDILKAVTKNMPGISTFTHLSKIELYAISDSVAIYVAIAKGL